MHVRMINANMPQLSCIRAGADDHWCFVSPCRDADPVSQLGALLMLRVNLS